MCHACQRDELAGDPYALVNNKVVVNLAVLISGAAQQHLSQGQRRCSSSNSSTAFFHTYLDAASLDHCNVVNSCSTRSTSSSESVQIVKHYKQAINK